MALSPTSSHGSGGAATLGASALVYRKTITGADAASIDTGVDTPDAGSNDWTGGDFLEVHMTIRTDDASAVPNVNVTLNNDTGSNYDSILGNSNNGGSGAATSVAQTAWAIRVHGSGGGVSYPGTVSLLVPNFAGTTFFKSGQATWDAMDQTAANGQAGFYGLGYRSTSAVTRLKVAGQSTAKLKVGSQLLIYKRLAS